MPSRDEKQVGRKELFDGSSGCHLHPPKHPPVSESGGARRVDTDTTAGGDAGPSARNSQPWHFIVLTDRQLLEQASTVNPYAQMAATAPLAILVCADTRLEKSPGYWPVDCAAAVENMLLAAHGLGLGAVWTGVRPRPERIEGFRRLFSLPESIIAHSMVVIG